MALDVDDPPAAQRLAQLVQEAGLPAARLSDDSCHLARAALGLRDQLAQDAELLRPADEGAEDAPLGPGAPDSWRPKTAHGVHAERRPGPRSWRELPRLKGDPAAQAPLERG